MTVSRVINQAASDVGQSSFDALPEHLMMDEFKSVKNVIGKMSFIYADAVSHRIVDVVADRKLKSLKDHFSLFFETQTKVKTVTIDMYEPYMSLIKQLFPNAKIIIDRFHIVQSLNRALNMSRVHVMNCYRTSNRPSIINIKVIGNYFLNLLKR